MNPLRALEIGYQLRLLLLPPNGTSTPAVPAFTLPASSSTTSLSSSSRSATFSSTTSTSTTSHRLSHVYSSLPPPTRAQVSRLLSPLGIGATMDDAFFAYVRALMAGGTVYEPGAKASSTASNSKNGAQNVCIV